MDKEILASLALVVGASVIAILAIGSIFCQGEIWLERWTQETGLTEQAARLLIAIPKLNESLLAKGVK
jgi:hypothetical protein